jgi:hypothetical protein
LLLAEGAMRLVRPVKHWSNETMQGSTHWVRYSMRAACKALILLFLVPVPYAVAQQGIVEECKIESFDYEERGGRLLIQGSATCSEARLEMTVFDDTTGEELGSDFTYIMDGEFELFIAAPAPEAILIEYNIE